MLVKIPSCLFASLNLKEGFHGIAHGTVFIVNVHLSPLNIGTNGVMFVSQRPIRLKIKTLSYLHHYRPTMNFISIWYTILQYYDI